MLDQVKDTFPGASVAPFGPCSYSVSIAGHTTAFHYIEGLWSQSGISSPFYATLEEARDVWYKELREQARQDFDELRQALQIPKASPAAPEWPSLVFVREGHGWKSTDGHVEVMRATSQPVSWRATTSRGGYAIAPTPQESLQRLVQSLKGQYAEAQKRCRYAEGDAHKALRGLEVLGVPLG